MSSPDGPVVQTRDAEATRSRVLLVEDDDAVAGLFGKILRCAGYEIVHASDGNEAKPLLEGMAFDAIVTDFSMPSMNGIELLEVVRSRDGHVPVVLVTGKPQMVSAVGTVYYRTLRYLAKPVTPSELRRAVADAIEVGSASTHTAV